MKSGKLTILEHSGHLGLVMGLIYLYDYYVCNEGLLEEFDKEENVAVQVAAMASSMTRRL